MKVIKSNNIDFEKRREEKTKKNPKLVVAIIAIVFVTFVLIGVLGFILYNNSSYRTVTGTFEYKVKYNIRKYEMISSNKSIDMFQIKDLDSADCDCYMYVGTYDPAQDLQETLDIVNKTDGTNLKFMNTTVGSEKYPAIFVDYINDKGGYVYLYYIDYGGKNYVIQTQADAKHQKEVDEMVDSFTIIK